MGYFPHFKRTSKTKFTDKYQRFLKLLKTYIAPRENLKFFEKKEFRFRKKKIQLRYRYRNWTLVLVPDTETWFLSHTKADTVIASVLALAKT